MPMEIMVTNSRGWSLIWKNQLKSEGEFLWTLLSDLRVFRNMLSNFKRTSQFVLV
jgi:hypothetical protein